MSKFIFKLQSFLNVKEKIEEQKKMDYGKSISNLEREKSLLLSIYEKKDNSINSIKNKLNSKLNAFDIKKLNEYILFLDNEIEKQKKVIEEHEKIVDEARLELVKAMKERKMIETLKDKEKEAYNKEESIKEQKILDELVSYKYNVKY